MGSCENADSGSAGLGWGPRVCVSEKFPGDADAAALGPTLCVARALTSLTCNERGDVRCLWDLVLTLVLPMPRGPAGLAALVFTIT